MKVKTYISTNETTLREAAAVKLLNSYIEPFHTNIKVNCFLLTCNFLPDECTIDEAWKLVTSRLEKVLSILFNQSDVIYTLSAIEEHPSKKNKNEDDNKKTSKDKKKVNNNLLPLPSPLSGNINTIIESTEKEEKNTLKGYPHIHIVVACTSKDGSFRNISSLERLIYDESIFKDVNAKTKGRKKKFEKYPINDSNATQQSRCSNDSKIIGYILKNSRYQNSYQKLGCNPVKLQNPRNINDIDIFYTRIINETACIVDGVNTIIQPELSLPIFEQKVIGDGSIITSSITNKIPPRNALESMIHWVISYMENYDIYIGEDLYFYRKVKESKMTWNYCGTIDDLFAVCADFEHAFIMLKQRDSLKILLSNPKQKIFPKIIMDFGWIEFCDFFIHLETGIITTEQNTYPCFCFINNYKYEDFVQVYNSNKRPIEWCRILQNSSYLTMDDQCLPTEKGLVMLHILFELLLPVIHKRKRGLLYGDSNAGKTTLLAAITDILPKNKVGAMRKSGGFELGCLIRNLIVTMDEFELITYGLTRETLLQILEGGVDMSINQKFKDPITEKPIARPIIMANSLESWIYGDNPFNVKERIPDPAYLARLELFFMKALPNTSTVIGIKSNISDNEKGLVVLYLFYYYYKDKILVTNNKDEITNRIVLYRRERDYENII